MASLGIIEIGSKAFSIIQVSINFTKDTSPSGRTKGMVRGGTLHVMVAADATTAHILEIMLSDENKPFDGKMTFNESGDSTKELKSVSFKKGYVAEFTEDFQPTPDGRGTWTVSFAISSQVIDFGSSKLTKHWPGGDGN